jgi:hypothetical protein
MNVIKATLVTILSLSVCVTQTVYPFAVAYAQEAAEVPGEIETSDEATEETEETSTGETGEVEESTLEDEGTDEESAQDEESDEGEESSENDEGEDTESETDEEVADDDMATSSIATSSDVMELEEDIENTPASTTSTQGEELSTTTASTTGSTTIVSGTSIALANILNLVNSNFVNSEGVVLFSNFFESVMGAIDFREYFANAASFGCSLISCQGEHVAVNVNNNASIDNEVLITANSGGNTIENSGHGEIRTGDAYAGLNLINVANTNLVDSNYLLVTLNAFQDVNGDVVFPSLSQFFGSLASGASNASAININNTAGVNNTVNVEADAGGNSTEVDGSSSIQTGNAVGTSNVFNQLNSSLIGGQSVSVVFRVHGSWAGEIFGAPDNLAWSAGDDGSIYLFDVGGGGAGGGGDLTMHGTSTAMINNNVNVIALTGENAITGSETAVISTGNAYAGANIVNVANANVIGRNWILAVINIFGDFNGNIAFGRPDTWLGGQIDVPQSIKNGSELTYELTVINNGDSDASNVKLDTQLNGDYLKITDASHDFTEHNGKIEWNLGKIPAGGATTITYDAVIENTEPGTEIVTTSNVRQRETDNNLIDNKEVLAIKTDERGGNGIRIELGSKSKSATPETPVQVPESLELEIERITSDITITSAHRTAEEKLILRNNTDGVAKNVVLHDVLTDAAGNIVRDEVWELGDVLAHEEIELGYTITFKENAALGLYKLHTTLEGGNVSQHEENGTITYTAITLPESPLLSSLQSASASQESAVETSDEVYYGKETPIAGGAFGTPVAEAAENDQLAAAFGSGFSLDPIIAFFIVTSGFLLFSLMRLFRVF